MMTHIHKLNLEQTITYLPKLEVTEVVLTTLKEYEAAQRVRQVIDKLVYHAEAMQDRIKAYEKREAERRATVGLLNNQ